MSRKRRPFVRESAYRDARLIVIATEDSKASKTYFDALTSPEFYQSPGVEVKILSRLSNEVTHSSPKHVLEQLKQWRKT